MRIQLNLCLAATCVALASACAGLTSPSEASAASAPRAASANAETTASARSSTLGSARAPVPNPASNPAELLVGSDLDNLPFAGVDAQGAPIGRDVEMMESIAAKLGRRIRWHRAPFDTLLPAARGGWTDVICATLGITEERAKTVLFSRPYFETVVTVVVRSGPGEPRGWDDLNGKLVAAGAGTTSESAVRSKLPRAQLALSAKQGLTSAERLLLGEVDGIAMDGPAADALVAGSGGALTTLHTPLATESYALALPKDRSQLVQLIDAALRELEASGDLQRLNGKWGVRSVGRSSEP